MEQHAENAAAHRNALLELGWPCTALETDWQTGAVKFVVTLPSGVMQRRRFAKGGALEITRL